ncbi:MAG: LamG domain-containing protein, partial [Thermoplasmata archaeon]|nr:LamG domain-containing protein [Thermoplasmata archaeon]
MKINKETKSMAKRTDERHSAPLQTVACLALALLILLSSLTIMPNTTVSGAIFDDIGGPDATFRDVVWENDGEYAMVVGNDTGNGVSYRYTASNETWDPLVSVPGDSYNAVAQTEPYVWGDNVENGENGWTTSTWEEDGGNDLIGEWKFEDGLGINVNDTSGNEHHGTLVDADTGTCWIDGISGKAIDFNNPADYVEIADVADLTSGSFSGDCWVNLTTHVNAAGIVDKYAGAGPGWGIWDQTGGGIKWFAYNGLTTTSVISSAISVNEWHHIAWVYNESAGSITLYIDGEQDNSGATVNPGRGVTPMSIGKYWTYYLNGAVDEVRLFNQALSHSEISDYYNETANKVGEWHFDEGAGTIAVDTSQHDNNGTLNFMVASDWVEGVSGKALNFDGANKFVECGNDASLDLPLEFTIQSWVNTADTGEFQTVVSKDYEDSATGISYAYLLNIDNRVIIYLGDGATSESHISNTPLAVDTWNHIAIVATDTELIFYLNGQPDGVFAHSMTPQVIASNVLIGTKNAVAQHFNGAIDEVNIWNYSLSASDILDNYNEGWDYYLEEQTRMGDWKFDEGANGFAYDDSQYERTGTLMPTYPTNAPVWATGISGSALYFDGDDAVETDYIPNTFNLHDHSIEAWVHPTDNVAAGVIYAVGEVGANGKTMEFKIANDEIQIWHWGWNWNTGISINTNEWTHLAYTYDTSIRTGYLYVNGQYIDSYIYGGDLNILNDASIPSQIGHGFSSNYFKGYIDEVKIWNRILDPTEVLDSYGSALSPTWHIVDPTTLPTPGSGVAHGSANSSANAWWFGHNETGSYDNGAKVTGSLI